MARVLHFRSDAGGEYVVLTSGEDPDEAFARPGYVFKAYDLGSEDWPISLPLDRELQER